MISHSLTLLPNEHNSEYFFSCFTEWTLFEILIFLYEKKYFCSSSSRKKTSSKSSRVSFICKWLEAKKYETTSVFGEKLAKQFSSPGHCNFANHRCFTYACELRGKLRSSKEGVVKRRHVRFFCV